MIMLKNCCHCISLRTGTIIIGAVEIIWAFCFIGMSSGGMGYIPGLPFFAIQAIMAAIVITWLVVAALLLAGTIKDRPKFIKIYIIGIAVLVLLCAAFQLVSAIFLLIHKLITMAIVALVILAIELGLSVVSCMQLLPKRRKRRLNYSSFESDFTRKRCIMFQNPKLAMESDHLKEERRQARENTMQNLAGYIIVIGVINLIGIIVRSLQPKPSACRP